MGFNKTKFYKYQNRATTFALRWKNPVQRLEYYRSIYQMLDDIDEQTPRELVIATWMRYYDDDKAFSWLSSTVNVPWKRPDNVLMRNWLQSQAQPWGLITLMKFMESNLITNEYISYVGL